MLALGLQEYCLSAVETLAATALDNGEFIPRDVLGHVHDALERLHGLAEVGNDKPPLSHESDHEPRADSPKANYGTRLKAVLDAHPEPLRSSEHHRVHAATAATWRHRVATLRRAVELDSANLQARCELAEALALTGERDEAWSLYADLASASADTPPCSPEEAMRILEDQAVSGVDGVPLLSPDDPVEFMLFH